MKIINRIGRILLYWVFPFIFRAKDFIQASTLENKFYNYEVWYGKDIGLDDAFDRWPHLFSDIAKERILRRRSNN